jgi:hypothetical protein
MPKHPHLLLFINKKTWKCMLEGCNFFVHDGLRHVLLSKSAMCWNCNGRFTITDQSLRDDKPICDECRTGASPDDLEAYMKSRLNGENE